MLEAVYSESKNPHGCVIEQLATQFRIPLSSIKKWFQNRRSKEKRLGCYNSYNEAQRIVPLVDFGAETLRSRGQQLNKRTVPRVHFDDDQVRLLEAVYSEDKYPQGNVTEGVARLFRMGCATVTMYYN